MWMWKNDVLIDLGEIPNRMDKILVAAGLTSTTSEATRLIKGNGVRFKQSLTWEPVPDPRTKLPEGKPVIIRIGKTSWRLVPREGRDGWDGFPTYREVMIPTANQDFEFWKGIDDMFNATKSTIWSRTKRWFENTFNMEQLLFGWGPTAFIIVTLIGFIISIRVYAYVAGHFLEKYW